MAKREKAGTISSHNSAYDTRMGDFAEYILRGEAFFITIEQTENIE